MFFLENARGSGDAGQCQMRRQRQLEEQQLNKEFGQQQTFDMQQLNRTLLCLCLTYVIFCGTLLPIGKFILHISSTRK